MRLFAGALALPLCILPAPPALADPSDVVKDDQFVGHLHEVGIDLPFSNSDVGTIGRAVCVDLLALRVSPEAVDNQVAQITGLNEYAVNVFIASALRILC